MYLKLIDQNQQISDYLTKLQDFLCLTIDRGIFPSCGIENLARIVTSRLWVSFCTLSPDILFEVEFKTNMCIRMKFFI